MITRNTLILDLAGVAIFYLLYKQKEFDTSSYLNKVVDLEKKVDSLHSQNKTLNVTKNFRRCISYSGLERR